VYRHSALFLMFINGKDVNDWVDQQREVLTDGIATGIATTNEKYWKDLKKAFEDAYVDTGEKLNAHRQLEQLKMVGGNVDSYIATFNRLTKTAGFTSSNLGTIMMFRNGLNQNLHRQLIMLPIMPSTLAE